MYAKIVRDYQVFMDGRGLLGLTQEFELPKLTIKTEDDTSYDGAIKRDMGQEAMDASITLMEWNPEIIKLWGLVTGNEVTLSVRGAMVGQDGEVRADVHTMRGRIIELDQGTWKKPDKAQLKITMNLTYYKLVQGGEEVLELHPETYTRSVGGRNQLDAIKNAIGA